MTHAETAEDEKMHRLKRIDEKLYNTIMDMESDLMTELHKKMEEISKIKDLSLAYKRPESRAALKKLKAKFKKSTSKK